MGRTPEVGTSLIRYAKMLGLPASREKSGQPTMVAGASRFTGDPVSRVFVTQGRNCYPSHC